MRIRASSQHVKTLEKLQSHYKDRTDITGVVVWQALEYAIRDLSDGLAYERVFREVAKNMLSSNAFHLISDEAKRIAYGNTKVHNGDEV